MKLIYEFIKNKLNIENFFINKISFNQKNKNFEIEIIKIENQELKNQNINFSFNELNDLNILSEITQYFQNLNINNNLLNSINQINYYFKIFLIFLVIIIISLFFISINLTDFKLNLSEIKYNLANKSIYHQLELLIDSNKKLELLIELSKNKPKYVYRIDSFEDYEFEKKINELGSDGWELVFARRALRTKGYKYDYDLGITEDYEGVYECIFRKKIN
jgi:hypothetical protein